MELLWLNYRQQWNYADYTVDNNGTTLTKTTLLTTIKLHWLHHLQQWIYSYSYYNYTLHYRLPTNNLVPSSHSRLDREST